MIYAIKVVFNDREYWSKPYTYKSYEDYNRNDLVIVPAGTFYSIGKVVESIPEDKYEFKPEINYRFVIKKALSNYEVLEL